VLVKRKEAEQKKGAILLPESAQKKATEGVVIAVGPGRTDDKGRVHPLDVKVGDRVLFSSYAGAEFEDHLIITQEDLMGVYHG
jgi:chaperonin GroES